MNISNKEELSRFKLGPPQICIPIFICWLQPNPYQNRRAGNFLPEEHRFKYCLSVPAINDELPQARISARLNFYYLIVSNVG